MDELPEGYARTPTYWVIKETATGGLWGYYYGKNAQDECLDALAGLDPLKYYAEEIGGIIFWTG